MKIFSLSSCILTFLLGWIFGSVFIFFFLSYYDDGTHQKRMISFTRPLLSSSSSSSSIDGGRRNNYHHRKTYLRYQSHQQTLMPEHLPDLLTTSVMTIPLPVGNRNHNDQHPPTQATDDEEEEEEESAADDKKQDTKEETEPIIIYLYWPYSDDQFSIHQYKAFESILSNFPEAQIRLTLLPTIQQFQHFIELTSSSSSSSSSTRSFRNLKFMKMKGLFHPNLFEKYLKMSYHIELSFLTMKQLGSSLETLSNEDGNGKEEVGRNHRNGKKRKRIPVDRNYLKKYLTNCCDGCVILCYVSSTPTTLEHHHAISSQKDPSKGAKTVVSSQHTTPLIPYHLISYLHSLLLYRTGGMFTDFSFYFINPLESSWIRQGYFIHAYCTHVKPIYPSKYHHHQHQQSKKSVYSHEIEIYYPKLYDNWKELQCYSSSLYYFPLKKNEILQCLLEKYSLDKVFLICIDSDTFFHGANCIKEAFDQCLHSINDERMNLMKSNNYPTELSKLSSLLLYSTWKQQNDYHLPTTSSYYLINSFSTELPDQISMTSEPSLTPESAKVDQPATKTAREEELEIEKRATGILESFQNNPMIANSTVLSIHNWTVNSNARILWVGHLAWQQLHLSSAHAHSEIDYHHHQHHFYPYPKDSLLAIAEKRNQLFKLDRLNRGVFSKVISKFQHYYSCKYYQDDLVIPQFLLHILQNQQQRRRDRVIETRLESNNSTPLLIEKHVTPTPRPSSSPVSTRSPFLPPIFPQNRTTDQNQLPNHFTRSDLVHTITGLLKNANVSLKVKMAKRSDEPTIVPTQYLSMNRSVIAAFRNETNNFKKAIKMLDYLYNATTNVSVTTPSQENLSSESFFRIPFTNSTTVDRSLNQTLLPLLEANATAESNSSAVSVKHHLRGFHGDSARRRKQRRLISSGESNSVFSRKSILRTNRTNHQISLTSLFQPNLHLPLETHKQPTKQNEGRNYENDLSCTPAIFLVGFVSTGCEPVITALKQHPLVLSGFESIAIPSTDDSVVHYDGCYNIITPDYYSLSPNNPFSSAEDSNDLATLSSQTSAAFSRSSCYPHVDFNESFIIMDTSLQYNLNPFTPYLIKQDHSNALILFFLENPVHRLMKHSKLYCGELLQKQFYGYDSLDSYLLSFIDKSTSVLSKFRSLLYEYLEWQEHPPSSTKEEKDTYQADLNHILEFFYFEIIMRQYHFAKYFTSMKEEETNQGLKSEKQQKDQEVIGFELFLHSLYFPTLYYYMNVFPIENILIINTEKFYTPMERKQNKTTRTWDQQPYSQEMREIFEFLHIDPEKSTNITSSRKNSDSSYDSVLKNIHRKNYRQSEGNAAAEADDVDEDDQFYETSNQCELSIDVYDKLVHYFTPFNIILEQYLNFSIAHWNEEYDPDEANYRPTNLLSQFLRGENESLPLLWYELMDLQFEKRRRIPKPKIARISDSSKGNKLVEKLVPQRTSEEDSGFNTTLGMLNTF